MMWYRAPEFDVQKAQLPSHAAGTRDDFPGPRGSVDGDHSAHGVGIPL